MEVRVPPQEILHRDPVPTCNVRQVVVTHVPQCPPVAGLCASHLPPHATRHTPHATRPSAPPPPPLLRATDDGQYLDSGAAGPNLQDRPKLHGSFFHRVCVYQHMVPTAATPTTPQATSRPRTQPSRTVRRRMAARGSNKCNGCGCIESSTNAGLKLADKP